MSLREKYRREVTYWEEVSIYGTDNPKQKWHLLEAMSFIDAVYKPRTKSNEVTFKRRKTENNSSNHQFTQLQSLFNSSNGFGQNSLLQSMFQMDARDDDVSISPEIISESRSGGSPEMQELPSERAERHKDSHEHEINGNSWNKNKYLSFGKYIGEELCSMRHHEAEELHEALMLSVLEFKRKAKNTKESSSN